MKLIIGLFLMMAISATAMAREVTCVGNSVAQSGTTFGADARFVIDVIETDGVVVARSIAGHVVITGEFERVLDPKQAASDYYSVFSLKDISENTKYNPRKYTNHHQFKKVNSIGGSRVDGGGMWGNLVMSKKLMTERSGEAVYIFQSGDHMGGSLLLNCSTRW